MKVSKVFETRYNTENTTGKSTIVDFKQEYIPVGCVLPACYHMGGGGLCRKGGGVSLTETPWSETILGHVTCGACWDRDPPVNRITDRCKTLPCSKLRLRGVIISHKVVHYCQMLVSKMFHIPTIYLFTAYFEQINSTLRLAWQKRNFRKCTEIWYWWAIYNQVFSIFQFIWDVCEIKWSVDNCKWPAIT